MIYSPEHNFLLLKNHKVGGSSLEVAIAKVIPNNAIVTPINGRDNKWDSKPKDHFERNYGDYFYNHIKYLEIEKKINLSKAKSYVFVRHPYELVLSDFFHRLFFFFKDINWFLLEQTKKEELVNRYFKDEFFPWQRSDRLIYLNNNNEILVNKILYYENGIENEINPILKMHGIPEISLNGIKEKSHKPKNIKYYDVFSKEHLNLIKKYWWWEFEYLNYKP